jgi:hypothetical protein
MAHDDEFGPGSEPPPPPLRALKKPPGGAVFATAGGGRWLVHFLFAHDGSHVAIQDKDGVAIWDIRSGRRMARRERAGFSALAFFPGGKSLQLL